MFDDFKREGPVNPDRLSRETIRFDQWDEKLLNGLLGDLPDFADECERLMDTVDTGHSLWRDTFRALHKASISKIETEGVRPAYRINAAIRDEMVEMAQYKELRAMGTVGDKIAAALATMAMRKDLQAIADRLETERDLARAYEERLIEYLEALEEQRSLDDMVDDLLNEKVQSLLDQLEALSQALDARLDQAGPQIRAALGRALKEGIQQAEAMAAASETWGVEPGSLQSMPAQKRIELAKRINNDRMRRIAELFGAMQRLMFALQSRHTNYLRDEVVDITYGNDLSRVLPSEFAALLDPRRRLDFYRRFVDRKLPQFELEGREKLAKGDIIYVEDGSGSMGGDREIWAKAVGLCLLNLAKKQKRGFRAIHFGSRNQLWEIAFTKPEHYTSDNILAFAEKFWGGGTDFESPLTRALERLQDQHTEDGITKADIVFATDGYCQVSDDWMKEFKDEQARLDFCVWGVQMDGGDVVIQREPLYGICDGRVATVAQLINGGDISEIFGGVGNTRRDPRSAAA